MEELSSAYHSKRMQLTAVALQRMMGAAPFSVSLNELSEELKLGVWEVQHLFEEYVGCDPLRLLNNSWSPGLAQINEPAQLSIFDEPEIAVSNHLFLAGASELTELTEDPDEITFGIYDTSLGSVFIATTTDGICQVTFEDAENGLERLQKTYPKTSLVMTSSEFQLLAVNHLKPGQQTEILPLKVKATPFQLSVWNSLLSITSGNLATYGMIASHLGDQNASRAVGTSVGANPIALFIPCHRVVHQSGKIGHFRWGTPRKRLLLAIEKG